MKKIKIFLQPNETELTLIGKNLSFIEIRSEFHERIRFNYFSTGNMFLLSNIEGGYYTFSYEGKIISSSLLRKERLKKLNKIYGNT